ncbi:uncharacterized protein LOC144450859 [Glandiceps talaboti]
MASIVRKLHISLPLRNPWFIQRKLFVNQVRHPRPQTRGIVAASGQSRSRKLYFFQTNLRWSSGMSGSKFPNADSKLPEEIEEILQSSKVQKDEELKSLLKEIASDFMNPTGNTGSQNQPGSKSEISSKDTDPSWKLETIDKDDRTPGGVFNIEELVHILREENVRDICVINIPKEKKYVDYFVIVSCRSTRHLQAVTQYVVQMHKQKKRLKDPFIRLEGKLTDDWMCIDFSNIVVHFFLPETREMYELEKLWTLGPQYDDQLRYLAEQSRMFAVQLEEQEDRMDTDNTEEENRKA